jgi:hypothetical protein
VRYPAAAVPSSATGSAETNLDAEVEFMELGKDKGKDASPNKRKVHEMKPNKRLRRRDLDLDD